MLKVAIYIILLLFASVAYAENGYDDMGGVSIVQLLANPERYHGKEVKIDGFVLFYHEGTAIYLERESATAGITNNSIWLNMEYIPFDKYDTSEYNCYCTVKGMFDMDNGGHFGYYQGGLSNIVFVKCEEGKFRSEFMDMYNELYAPTVSK